VNEKILAEIQSGEFARKWITEENKTAVIKFPPCAKKRAPPIEKVGAELRSRMMTFLEEEERSRVPEWLALAAKRAAGETPGHAAFPGGYRFHFMKITTFDTSP